MSDMVERVLTIPVKGVYFDAIAAGTKPEEYRLRTDYWSRRLEGRTYSKVVLTRGYPKGGGIEGATRLSLPWRGFTRKTITHPFFGAEPDDVFAINVALQEASHVG